MSKIPEWAEREAAGLWVSLGFVNDRLNHLPTIALALVAAEKRGSEWHPIETAPKDGSDILALIDGNARVVRWYLGINKTNMRFPWICQSGQNGWRSDVPTHWMPLPAPPAIRQLGRAALEANRE